MAWRWMVGLAVVPSVVLGGETASFWLFGLTSIIAFFIMYRLAPETKGRGLEETAADSRSRTSPRGSPNGPLGKR